MGHLSLWAIIFMVAAGGGKRMKKKSTNLDKGKLTPCAGSCGGGCILMHHHHCGGGLVLMCHGVMPVVVMVRRSPVRQREMTWRRVEIFQVQSKHMIMRTGLCTLQQHIWCRTSSHCYFMTNNPEAGKIGQILIPLGKMLLLVVGAKPLNRFSIG